MVVNSSRALEPSSQTAWTANQSMLLFFEALAKIKTHALTQPSEQEIVRQSIKGYLRSLDPYSDYLTSNEYTAFANAQQSKYIGLGMDIEKNAQGQLECYPYPQSPAEKAGIVRGAILHAIGGIDLSNMALPAIGAMLLGQEGTEVALTLQNPNQPIETLRLKRQSIRTHSVVLETLENLFVIKIVYFRADTLRKLTAILNRLPASEPIVIDLRDNPGGDLYRGIDCAMLFLERDQTIVEVQKAGGTKVFKSTDTGRNTASPLYLWQNEHTASAAEVFGAALTQNQRAVSIGKKTYGKGTTQDVIKLSDGSAMIITSAFLATPNGMRYHKKGLIPTYPLTAAAPTTKDYLAMVKSLISHAQNSSSLQKGGRPLAVNTNPAPEPVSKTALPQLEISVPPPDQHYICFDKKFESESGAESWAATLRYSYDHMDNQFLAQKGVHNYYICLGPYRSQHQAEQKGRAVTKITGLPVFNEVLKNEDSPDAAGDADSGLENN
jgi:carboxyl-terminal processing protease